MNDSDSGRLARIFEWLSPALSALTVFLGVLVMLGWAIGMEPLTSVLPGLTPMKFNTALLFAVAGIGLASITMQEGGKRAAVVSKLCAGAVFLVGVLTLAEYLTGYNLGIDELLVRDVESQNEESPGRMAWTTALNFSVCGMVLFLLVQNARRHALAIHAGAMLIVLIGVAIFLGYVYNIEALHRERLNYTPMALNTTFAFVMLGAAILNASPAYPLRRMMVDDGAAGHTARTLMPVAILLPLVGGMAVMAAHGHGYTGYTFAISVFAAAMITGFGAMVLWNARLLNRAEMTRKKVEHDLHAASLYARNLIEASLDPLVTISADGKITDVNRATEDVTGYGRTDLIGSDFADYFTDPGQARAGYKIVLQDGLVRDYPLTVRHRSGRTEDVLYNATIYRNAAGQVQGVLAAARVITELKRAEQARAQLAAIVESSGDGIIGTDLDGIIRSWNAGAERIYGYTAMEVVNTPASLLAPPEQRTEILQLLERARADNVTTNHEAVRQRKDGRQIHISLTLSPIRNEQQAIIGVSIIARDISAKKRAEEELHRYKTHLEEEVAARTEQLQAANKELEAFAYSVSHDLRVPLRAIDGFSRIVIDEYHDKLDDEGKRLLGVVSNNAQRMGQLIDDILALSRTGRTDMAVSPVDMNALAHQSVNELQSSMEGRAITINIGDLPPAQGDRNLLRQVFINLLTNAIKFTRPRTQAIIEISGRTEGGEQVYSVKDNGVGFDMQYAQKLYGVFQRLHGVDEFEGTGIGLAIVKRIVTRHGGRTWAEAVVDQGATFHFSLPRKEENHDGPQP